MSPRDAEPRERRCGCGAALRWEKRGAFREKRWLATCTNPSCGVITTGANDGADACLQTFLLDDAPVVRYQSPWARFYFRTAASGYRWHPHTEPCSTCLDELTVALDLAPRGDRSGDPLRVVLCLRCGAMASVFWGNGDRVEIFMDPSAWEEPAPLIQDLKRALATRAEEPAEPYPWDFR
jgi:hypothetical protein